MGRSASTAKTAVTSSTGALAAHGDAAVGAHFSYEALDEGVADFCKARAESIKSLGRRLVTDIILIGAELAHVKRKLPHGQFGLWIGTEFAWSERTAQLYMAAAEWARNKPETVADLQPTTIYLLASPSTPMEISAEVVERAKLKQVRHAQRETRKADAKRKRLAKMSPKARQRQLTHEAEEAKARHAAEQIRRARDVARSELTALLRRKLGPDAKLFSELMERAGLHWLLDLAEQVAS